MDGGDGIREESRQYNLLAVHKYIFPFFAPLGLLLGLKHGTGNLRSPFVTDHNTAVMLVADLLTYAAALVTAKILEASHNTDMYGLVTNISLLCGTLGLVLLVLLLIPALGWFTLACWAIYFAIMVTKSYQTLSTQCTDAVRYVHAKLKELKRRLKGSEPEPERAATPEPEGDAVV